MPDQSSHAKAGNCRIFQTDRERRFRRKQANNVHIRRLPNAERSQVYRYLELLKPEKGVKPVLNVKDKDESQSENWTAVATWRWIANDDNCGICRTAFDGCCPDCKMPGDDCPLVWGQCSHVFHMHCILKWLNSQQVHQLCPMCRQEWKFKE
ncbi:anaphase-promoting complex subunit 11-like [Lytechinus variegatus]|uniref:anaphase-promoting complex subunit 11-like n=1 Tax=Lytechinus variegatus TaxID=7654 RepID=UPI001BB2A248|nr:anaphase-promoting complex subunit 11-like [Lytechinus variegatus]